MMRIFMFDSCPGRPAHTSLPGYLLYVLSVYLHLLLNDIAVRPISFHPFCHSLQRRFNVTALVSHHRADDDCFLPLVLQSHLGDRDVKLTVQTRDQWLDAPALFFQGSTDREMEMNG